MNDGTPKEVGHDLRDVRARKHLRLQITLRQFDVLVGTVLGDAYIYPQGKVQIEHAEKQKKYLLWKFDELKSLAYPAPPQRVERMDARTKQTYVSYRFWLRQYFRSWRSVFYADHQKVFPEQLALSPLGLAVWYMDDGCLSDGACTISTESFSGESIALIQRELQTRFSLGTFYTAQGKLKIRAKDQERFFSTIQAFMHPSMLYKLP